MLRWSLERVALFSRRHYRPVFAVTALLVVVSLGLASRLRFDTDILALLPQHEPAIATFREALDTFGSVDYLLVAVRIPEGDVVAPYEAWVDRLGRRLEALDLFEEVEYRLGDFEELLREFLPSSLLFLDEDGLERVAVALSDERLEARARELRRLVSLPQSLALKDLIKLDPFGLADVFLDRVGGAQSGLDLDWSSGYFLARDRQMLLILAKPTRPPQDVDFSQMMVARVEREAQELAAEWEDVAGPGSAGPPEVVLGGRYVIALGDADLIRGDVLSSLATSMIGVLLLFLFAFRRFGPMVYAFLPLVCGLALTFGFSAATYGALSAATSGIAALLIGLGIDFVIVSYGRFVEERQRGATLEQALHTMSGSSGRAVLVGAVTSAATFYAFGVTDFTGLYQMGYLTGTGILLCVMAVLLLLPAMLSWNEDHHIRRDSFPRLFLHGFGTALWMRFCLRRPRLALGLGAALTVAAGFAASGLRFEDSVQAMRPKGNPATAIREEITARFSSGFDQMMLLVEGDTAEEVLTLSDRAYAKADEMVAAGVLRGRDGIGSLMPPPERQRRALEWLARERGERLNSGRIRATFSRALTAAGLRADPFREGMELLLAAVDRTEPLRIADLESSPRAAKLLDRYLIHGQHGWRGTVYLYPPPEKRWRRGPPPAAVQAAEELGPGVVLTGANVVSERLRTRVLQDAVKAAVLGFVLVALLLWLDYRRLGDTVLSLIPLAIGILWMLGAMAVLDLAMNFMNIFVSTMIIGIGVDYGVHMIHRFRELQGAPDDRLFQGLQETGKAIALAALSTIVGFGSLARSHYPGLSSMGIVAILGALATSFVAITLLPAYVALRRGHEAERPEGPAGEGRHGV